MIKLFSLNLDADADPGMTLHVRICYSQHGRRDDRLKDIAQAGQAGTESVLQSTKYFKVPFHRYIIA
jgi:hypothetical protein